MARAVEQNAQHAGFAGRGFRSGVGLKNMGQFKKPQALRALEIRVKAVYALRHEIDFPGIASREEELDAEALESNPLIRCFLPQGAELPPAEAPARQTLWCWRGIPFAREDGELLLSATGDPREEEAMAALGELTGKTLREDITQRIFDRFCVGK